LEKLLLVVMSERDADAALDTLTAQGHRVTLISSTGGFLRRGHATLMMGVAEEQVDGVVRLLKEEACRASRGGGPVSDSEETPPCGITLFVLDMESFQHV